MSKYRVRTTLYILWQYFLFLIGADGKGYLLWKKVIFCEISATIIVY